MQLIQCSTLLLMATSVWKWSFHHCPWLLMVSPPRWHQKQTSTWSHVLVRGVWLALVR